MRIPLTHIHISVSGGGKMRNTDIYVHLGGIRQCSPPFFLCWGNDYITFLKWQNSRNGEQISICKRSKWGQLAAEGSIWGSKRVHYESLWWWACSVAWRRPCQYPHCDVTLQFCKMLLLGEARSLTWGLIPGSWDDWAIQVRQQYGCLNSTDSTLWCKRLSVKRNTFATYECLWLWCKWSQNHGANCCVSVWCIFRSNCGKDTKLFYWLPWGLQYTFKEYESTLNLILLLSM